MDILNIQSLIAQGLITDIASIDPNKAYITVGVYQPGNRPAGSGNNTYPSYAIPVAEFLATGGVYTGSNGIALVGNDFQLASHLISQFTNDSGYITSAAIAGMVTGSGTLGKIAFWFPNGTTLGDSPLYTNGTQVGLNNINPSAMFDVLASGSGTIGINLGTTSTQNAKLHFSTNNALTARAQVYLDDATQTLNVYTVNNDTIFWNGNGLAQSKTLTLFTDTTAKFETSVGINQVSSGGIARLEITGGALQGAYIQTSGSIGVNVIDPTGFAVKGETSTGTALFAKITNGSGTTGIAIRAHNESGNTLFTVNGNSKVGVNTTNPLSAFYVESLVQNEIITLNNNDITGSSYFGLSQSGGIKAGMILLNSNHPFIPKTLIVRNLWDNGSLRINGGSADTNMMLFDTTTFNVGINIQNPAARLDIIGDATNPLFKVNNSNFLFADKLRVNNNGDFYSGSINAFGGFGTADFVTDHLNYRFNTSYQTYLAFTNAQGAGNKAGYGIIGSSIVNADSDYKLVILNNDAGTLGSVVKVLSTSTNNANDAFDYTNYGINIISSGIVTNAGAGTFYKTGINLDITNGDVNRAINVENGVIRVVKANQPLYATLTSGDFYYDTAANILANGDFVVGMKA